MQTINLTASDTTYVSKTQNKINFYDSPVIDIGLAHLATIGRFCLMTKDRALVKFCGVSTLPKSARIVAAGLHVYIETLRQKKNNCWSQIDVLQNTRDFDAQTVTWDTKPDTEETPSRIYCTQSHIPDYVCCDITSLVTRWHEGKTPNFGITLKMDRANCDFARASSMHSQKPPFLSLQFLECKQEKLEGENIEYVFEICKCAQECYTPSIKAASAQTVTFFIKNTGDRPVTVNLEISPDGNDFIDEAQVLVIPTGETNVLTPYHYAAYYRVRINSEGCADSPVARIWCQMQTRNFYMR